MPSDCEQKDCVGGHSTVVQAVCIDCISKWSKQDKATARAEIVAKLRERAKSLRDQAYEAAQDKNDGLAGVKYEEARGAEESADFVEAGCQ